MRALRACFRMLRCCLRAPRACFRMLRRRLRATRACFRMLRRRLRALRACFRMRCRCLRTPLACFRMLRRRLRAPRACFRMLRRRLLAPRACFRMLRRRLRAPRTYLFGPKRYLLLESDFSCWHSPTVLGPPELQVDNRKKGKIIFRVTRNQHRRRVAKGHTSDRAPTVPQAHTTLYSLSVSHFRMTSKADLVVV
jgi:hypothetical protein